MGKELRHTNVSGSNEAQAEAAGPLNFTMDPDLRAQLVVFRCSAFVAFFFP